MVFIQVLIKIPLSAHIYILTDNIFWITKFGFSWQNCPAKVMYSTVTIKGCEHLHIDLGV